MQIIRSISQMQSVGAGLLKTGKKLGLVPTMGYLHEAHLSLVDLLDGRCDVKAASIFVNPIQFSPGEDYESYPRDEQRDLQLLEIKGCEIVFIPSRAEMYPESYQTYVSVEKLSEHLCGRFRPGHFKGVATVVLRLFTITRCSVAVFGWKDYQQAKIIERINRELNLNIELLFGETLREQDGLALSSRNVYLSKVERKIAARLPKALEWARHQASLGERDCAALRTGMLGIIGDDPEIKVQYVEIVDPDELTSRDSVGDSALAALAVFVGRTRLIDNVLIGSKAPSNPIDGVVQS